MTDNDRPAESASERPPEDTEAKLTQDGKPKEPSLKSEAERDNADAQAIALADTPARENAANSSADSVAKTREEIAYKDEQKPSSGGASAGQKPAAHGSSKKGKKWWWLGAVALTLLIVAGMTAFLFVETRQLARSQASKIDALSQELLSLQSATRDNIAQLNSATTANRDTVENLQSAESRYANRLSDVESRTSAQAKRLLAMSDTSRDDWLLAEAEYLLKLANQRIRIERSAEGSEALLVEADAILRDLEDPSLHNLRRAIAKDLAALRLIDKIDVEGIYLSLVALAQSTDALPLRADVMTRSKENIASRGDTAAEQEDLNSWQRVKRSFQSFVASFDSYIAIESHSEKPKVLAPDSAVYIRQNLRLILERAQLALLREQQDIYRQSIAQAQQWVSLYYPTSQPRTRFIETLEDLKQKNIVSELPDISDSLNLLHEHIKNLHLLKGAQRTAPAQAQQELG